MVDGTRASSEWSSSFDNNIGIIAYTENGDIFNGYANEEYRPRYSQVYVFEAVGDGIYYSADANERIKFSAYYPYQELTDGNIYKVDLTQGYNNIDELLWAGMSTESYNKDSGVVALNMLRQYSTVRITLEEGDGYESGDVNGATVTISNITLKADFNVKTGEVAATETGSLTFEDRGVSAGWFIYVLPTAADVNRIVTVTLASGESFDWAIGDKAFEAGRYYQYNLRVNKVGSSFSFTVEDRVNEIMAPNEYIDL